jgi:AMMECR1 domain-containing protein
MQGPLELTETEKGTLLELARASLRAHLEGAPAPAIDERTLCQALREKAACFVTLTESGALRGCILDSFEPHESVARNVARNAVRSRSASSDAPMPFRTHPPSTSSQPFARVSMG